MYTFRTFCLLYTVVQMISHVYRSPLSIYFLLQLNCPNGQFISVCVMYEKLGVGKMNLIFESAGLQQVEIKIV